MPKSGIKKSPGNALRLKSFLHKVIRKNDAARLEEFFKFGKCKDKFLDQRNGILQYGYGGGFIFDPTARHHFSTWLEETHANVKELEMAIEHAERADISEEIKGGRESYQCQGCIEEQAALRQGKSLDEIANIVHCDHCGFWINQNEFPQHVQKKMFYSFFLNV